MSKSSWKKTFLANGQPLIDSKRESSQSQEELSPGLAYDWQYLRQQTKNPCQETLETNDLKLGNLVQ